MTIPRRLLLATLLSAASLTGATAQPSTDCERAKGAVEMAICGDPALAASDSAMAKAYAALLGKLSSAQQGDLRRDQQRWLKDRDAGCAGRKGAALTKCLRAATGRRHRFLAGDGGNGPAGALPLLPVFVHEAKKGAYEITVAYPRFPTPAGAAFNNAARDTVLGRDILSDYRQNKPNAFNGSSNFYQVEYDATYLDPHLVSVTFQFGDYQGGAHPNNWRVGLLWNPTTDRPVVLGDILADPTEAIPAIAALCKAQGEAQDWGLFDNPDFISVVKEAKSWAVDKDGVTIMFDPYSVTPYVAGPHDCRLSYADLKDWLKPGGPLPPQ